MRSKRIALKTLGITSAALAVGIQLLVSCNGRISDPSGDELSTELRGTVVVTPSNAMLHVGDALPLVADVRGVTWSSSDPAIATVTSSGVVTGVSSGTATITARARRRRAGTATIDVMAHEEMPPPEPPPTPTPTPETPPPPGGPVAGSVFGIADPAILGTCSAEVHDRHSVDGGDGFRYRTWHPQQDPSGCRYAHEHGDDPRTSRHPDIAATPVMFGYIGRRHPMPGEPNGHEEAHEGFKVFVANPGDVNDEGRVNRVFSRSVFHMGTGGPRRFSMPHHSADIYLVHPEFNLTAKTMLMMDTGGVAAVCDPRAPAPTKDVLMLGSPCKLNSTYEIWSTTQRVRFGDRTVYQVFATPAVFDPMTVFNPSNPTEVVYTWDARVDAILNFPGNSRNGYRGCDRESYAQPGYWYNGDTGRTDFYTDAMGYEVSPASPMALKQVISRSNSVGAPATWDGLVQFKMRRNYCGAGLGLKN